MRTESPYQSLRVLALAFAMSVSAAPAWAGGATLTIAHTAKDGSLVDATVDAFVQAANAELKGKASVKKAAAGADQMALRKKVKGGEITFMVTGQSLGKSFNSVYGVFEMPFLVRDRAHVKRLQDKKKGIAKKLSKAVKKKFVVVGYWEHGFRHIANDTRPIMRPGDLKGVSITSASAGWLPMAFETYGASVNGKGPAGAEASLEEIASGKTPKYVSLSAHAYIPAFLIVGKKSWKQMSKDNQKAIRKAAEKAQKFAYEEGAKRDEAAIEKLKAGGAEVNKLDRSGFVDASTPVYDKFATTVNGAFGMLNQVNSLAASGGS